jgi:hypothetical protein
MCLPTFYVCNFYPVHLREIGDVDEGIIEGGEDAGNAKDEFT